MYFVALKIKSEVICLIYQEYSFKHQINESDDIFRSTYRKKWHWIRGLRIDTTDKWSKFVN